MFAGAAFTDQADIKVDSDVVDTLVSLGVINGYTDGSFKPNDTVTRAEMAKMIYVLRTGNSDASAYNDDYSTFADIKGHWARGYVKYCQSLGIIAGQSATKFAPDQTVTAQEAAKMLLVTLGYDAQKAGLVGTTWASKTNALADENGLLEDVNTSFTGPCPRQYAAQLIYNAIDAATVVWRDDAYTKYNYNGDENKTIGEKYMGLSKTVGILSDVTKDTDKDTYTLSVDKNADESTGKGLSTFTKVAKDYSALKYQKVKVLYKDKDKVFGVYSMTDDNTVATAVMDDVKMDGGKLKIDGTKYTLADAAKTAVYVDGVYQVNKDINTYVTANAEGKNVGRASSVQAISNDDTNKINVLKVTTYDVKKVTYVGTDYINAGGAKKNDAWNYPSDIKKDDYAVLSTAKNYADDKGLITKAETVEGKVVGTKGDDKVKIGDTWYTADYKSGSTVIDNWPKSGATVKLVLVNGFVKLVDTVTAGTADMAMVIETGSASGLGSSKVADLMFADGTRKTVELNDDSEYGYNGTKVTLGAPKMATYEVSKGKYTLKKVGSADAARNGYDVYATNDDAVTKLTVDGNIKGKVTVENGKASEKKTNQKLYFKSNAVVFVKYKTDDYKVVTGKDVANWSKTDIARIEALGENTSGNYYVQVGVITMNTKIPGASNSNYAYALDDSYNETVDGTKYTFVKAWNGTEEVLFKSEDDVTISKREAFEYANNSDGTVDLTVLKGKNNSGTSVGEYYAKTQITSYDEGTGAITFKNAAADLSTKNKIKAGETTILYVNSDDKVGVGKFDIDVAEDVNADGVVEDNVIVYSESGEDYINLIVVDVNNYMH
ncbi:S-layer homology domain-containing protein [Agathobaculum sp.]|uniref:S-layer homology domain-containing protein n=1 Tax=Agathobaculum sp. TaxID=2048138 RepID=UPI003AB2DB61